MRFTVGKKIGGGFSVVVILLLFVFLYTFSVVNVAIKSNDKFLKIDQPSLFVINQLKDDLAKTQTYMQKWVIEETRPDDQFKLEAEVLLDSTILYDLETIKELSSLWISSEGGLEEFNDIYINVFALIESYNFEVREVFINIDSYQDEALAFNAQFMFEEISANYDFILKSISDLSQIRTQIADKQQIETNNRFANLINSIIFFSIIIVLGTILIAIFTTLSITKPVQSLKVILLGLGKGIFPKNQIEPSNDEIGEMSEAMNSLVTGLTETTQFAHEIGQSNFDYKYQPLSDEDVLGHALLKMKDELAETERILEQKVKERTEEVVKQKAEIEELYTDVTASIRYAKRLQDSILPPEKQIKKYFPSSFVLFKPKDIVSGDFYWIGKQKNEFMFAAVDCTGHGVPGAFMSLVGANGLNSAFKERKLSKPGLILDDLNRYANEALNKSADDSIRDGMDITLCSINSKEMKLRFAGANNPVYLIRDGELEIYKTNKFAIGSFNHEEHNYENFEIDLIKGDKVYAFSDGYPDQFGGERGKKFMYKKFKELLVETVNESMENQKRKLEERLAEWMGNY
ncbi:MAG: SpoIIE family protein phosphatase, partial [Flavobacteriales bacterium]|nr:SpoIIE family protein phosphatase [Flavobacteriales bacterium]